MGQRRDGAATNESARYGRARFGLGCWGAGGGGCLKMADVAGEGAAAYWSQDDSDEEQQMVYMPGLCREGNCRAAPKTKSLKASCAKPGNQSANPAARMEILSDWGQNQYEQQVVQPEAGIRSASLKDLCPEDKRRIANLIKELARVSEEKEVTEERLKTEHESFEKKIRHLEEQNNLIATEREALQQQYRECQEMLSLYQKYLSEQQEKLNLSVTELSGARSSRPQQVPKTPRLPTASELNGSYLCQQNRKASSESGSLCSIVPHPRSDPISRNGCHCAPDGVPSENCLQTKCAGAHLPSMHYTDFPCNHHCSSALKQPVSHCCLHPTAPDLSLVRHPEDCSFSRCSTVSGTTNRDRARLRESTVRRGISEQRKQELLLQKLEVEIEKERLQKLLAQQEVKLLEKQQQLQQARLEANRTRPNPETQVRETEVMSTPLPGAVKLLNGSRYSPVILTPPSSKSRRKPQSPGKNVLEGRTSGLDGEDQEDCSDVRPRSTFNKGSRKDAATSPKVKSPKMETKTAGMSAKHRDLYRYETSLINILEAISPISSERRQPQHRELYDFSILSPTPRGNSKSFQPPVRRHDPPSVEPEEREMLEEIFFIC
ncbi:protein hinderin isoform X2 [Hyla sarda]|uniref:protein hinderin isoform X2 n=1 Tax=Hyla sarda TaxID=327740 RepID=UPI0024C427EB|nr:protein hinderin isoform X2 [Hyla sarda]